MTLQRTPEYTSGNGVMYDRVPLSPRVYSVLLTVLSRVVECGVVVVVFAVAEVRIEVLPQLRRALVDLHGGEFVAVLEVFLELGRCAAHVRSVLID